MFRVSPQRDETTIDATDWQWVKTSSSAVAKRPRDASCVSVVRFNSTKRRVESFILSYVGYSLSLRAAKFWWYVYSFWHNSRTWQTHKQTDRHRMTAQAALMHSIARRLVRQTDCSVWPWALDRRGKYWSHRKLASTQRERQAGICRWKLNAWD